MKKLLLSFLVACMFCLPAFAQQAQQAQQTQGKDRQAEYAEWQLKIKDELKLTDEQVSRWNALDAEYKEKTNETMQSTTLDKDAQKARMMELRKEKNARFLEILTPEQQVKYTEIIEKKKKDAAAAKPSGN